MTYDDALAALDALGEFHVELGLDRIAEVLSRLGNPHEKFASVHVAGTNGKGSTAVFTEAMLRAAGLSVGIYTSPHLRRLNERIVVNGEEISDEAFARHTGRTLEAAGDTKLTYFEVVTAVAFLYFEACNVDIAVLETGLGGRLDATNVVTPIAAILTNIALDHTDILGETIEEIAAEKAAIIKPGVPVIVSTNDEAARKVIFEAAAHAGAQMILLDEEISPGAHHRLNAATAAAAARVVLRALERDFPAGAMQQALLQARLPGRGEIIEGTPELYLDGAHNPVAAAACAAAVASRLAEDGQWSLLFAAMRNKDHAGIFAALAAHLPPPQTVVLTKVDAGGREADPAVLAEHLPEEWPDPTVEPDIEQARIKAVSSTEGLVLVTGSFYLVGQMPLDTTGTIQGA